MEARMNETTTTPERRFSPGKLGLGLVLLVAGVATFSDAIDIWDARELVRYWPVIPIVIGLFSELESLSKRTSDGGYLLIAFGVWMLFATHHYFDLDARTAFPLGIIIVGLGVMLHAIVDRPEKAEKENEQ
jgi:hypothetical protein